MRDGSGGNEGKWGGLAAVSALAGLMIAGCATGGMYPPPTSSQLAGAESNVKAARDSGAGNDAKAAPLLRAAEEELSLAKDRTAAGDNRAATLLLARAEADAELGHLLARQARARTEAALIEGQLAETRQNQARAPSNAPASATTPTPAPTPAPTPTAAPSPVGGPVSPPVVPATPRVPATTTSPAP
jgi:hypothetical protein